VQRDEGALGYFGLAYYEENQAKLKAVSVDGVQPTAENANTGKYKPLSRPLFVYVERKAAERPEIAEFVKFFLTDGKELVKSVGYVPLPDELYTAAQERFTNKVTGTMYAAKDAKKKPLADLMAAGK
jgi:phosphate transport system substrate-binding protein